MIEYTISFARSARKELESLPNDLIERIILKIEKLSLEPRPNGCKKLQGYEHLWRIRVGDYRIIYSIDDRMKMVDINQIRHRKDVYR